MSSNPPGEWTFSAAMNYISQQLGLFNAQLLDLNKRQDDQRDRTGALHEQQREAVNGLRDRIEAVELALNTLAPQIETTHKILSELRPVIERQVEHAGRVAEAARQQTLDMGARYQASLGEVQTDFEERQTAARIEMTDEVAKARADWATEKAGLVARVAVLETAAQTVGKENVEVRKAQITTRGTVIVAAITILGGGLVGGIVSIILSLVGRGAP